MNIHDEYYKEVLEGGKDQRNVELDARTRGAEAEKCLTDEDMWRVHDTLHS